MPKSKDEIVSEIQRNLDEFQEKLKERTSDSDFCTDFDSKPIIP